MRLSTILSCLLTLSACAFAVDDTETTRQTLNAAPVLEVHNLNGVIRVTAANTSNVELVATRVIRADDAAELARAKTEVKLDVRQESGRLRVCVVYRSWNPCEERRGSQDSRRQRYDAKYDLELRVPAKTEIDLAAVNGPVEAAGIRAPFRAKTVNGRVTLTDMDGAGSAETVNGEIRLSFSGSPKADVSAKTVNGRIRAEFPRNLNANLRFKTFHGEVFTDFQATIPAGTTFRRDREFTARVGSGGPEHRFQTLNGEIEIAQK